MENSPAVVEQIKSSHKFRPKVIIIVTVVLVSFAGIIGGIVVVCKYIFFFKLLLEERLSYISVFTSILQLGNLLLHN